MGTIIDGKKLQITFTVTKGVADGVILVKVVPHNEVLDRLEIEISKEKMTICIECEFYNSRRSFGYQGGSCGSLNAPISDFETGSRSAHIINDGKCPYFQKKGRTVTK
jgi:hypothetical protein